MTIVLKLFYPRSFHRPCFSFLHNSNCSTSDWQGGALKRKRKQLIAMKRLLSPLMPDRPDHGNTHKTAAK